ncbi:MAG: hypothetical protein ACSW8H_08480, partial [bacterium]
MKMMKRFLSLVLAVVLVAAGLPVSSLVTAQADPPAQQSADGGYFDPTDINIPIDFSGTDQTKGSAVAKTLNYLPQKDQVVWKHPKSWEDFEALIKSTKPEDTYISLTQDIQHQWGKTLMETVSITKNKVVDLNGHTITCNLDYNVLRDYNKYTGNFSDPYPNPNEPYYYKTLMNIDEGATFYLLDSSMRNSVNGKEGTGKIQVYGWMLNPFKNDINYYPNYDIFSVSNGNLVVYGGHLMAGRSKGQMDSKFSWSKLRAVIGQTVELASNVAAYAIGIKEATSGVGDAKKAFNSAVDAFKDVKDDKEVDPKETKTENPEMTTTSPDNNKPAMKTIGGKQNDINKAKQSNSSENNGEQKTNSDGTAKSDEGSKMESNDSAIAEAILDKEKLD